MDATQVTKIANKILNDRDARMARKSLDYYDGKQLTHMVELLNHPQRGRRNWQDRGYFPLFRNLTKSVVERSGMLFNSGMPTVSYYDLGTSNINDTVATLLGDYLHDSHFNEFLINCDDTVRLLKTIWILIDYDATEDKYSFNLLHEGNCEMRFENGATEPTWLAYVRDSEDDDTSLRVITSDKYEDWVISKTELIQGANTFTQSRAEKVGEFDNPYGFIPVSTWHDTKLPRNGRECEADYDLVNLNEALNLFMTDINYAGAWSLRKTLFTNASFGDTTIEETFAQSSGNTYNQKLLLQSPSSNSAIAGPDQAVVVDTRGVDAPFIDYKGPEFNLNQLVDLWKFMIEGICHDWSVSINFDGNGTANSGFQLVVQEIPNLELRNKRQRMAEMAIQRIIGNMLLMHTSIYGTSFIGDVYVEFPEAELPIDVSSKDKLWYDRIDNKVASRQDYLMNVMGMTLEEANEKVVEINLLNASGESNA